MQGNSYSYGYVFHSRLSDARGDARPDFIYTLTVSGVN